MARKKPTLKEMEKVINLVIQQMEVMIQRVNRLEYITETYHEYKKEKEEFIKYLNEKIERDDKIRNSDSLRDDQERDISDSGGSDREGSGNRKKKTNSKKKEERDNESV